MGAGGQDHLGDHLPNLRNLLRLDSLPIVSRQLLRNDQTTLLPRYSQKCRRGESYSATLWCSYYFTYLVGVKTCNFTVAVRVAREFNLWGHKIFLFNFSDLENLGELAKIH